MGIEKTLIEELVNKYIDSCSIEDARTILIVVESLKESKKKAEV